MSDVAVVLVNWRAAAEVEQAVATLAAAAPGLRLETIVVDNASGLLEVERLRRVGGIRIIESGRNLGFARACNLGAARARAESLLFLNPDARARPGSIARLHEAARAHPEAMVLAPRLVNADGSYQHNARAFYRLPALLARRTPLRFWLQGSGPDRAHLLDGLDPLGSHEVDWVTGAALFMRRETFLALGGFDPRFFLYFEDVDLCLRAWRAGGSVRHEGQAVMEHGHRRQSFGPWPSQAKLRHARSLVYFLEKHAGLPSREDPVPGRPIVFVHQGRGALGDRASRFARALGGRVLAKDRLPGGRSGRALLAAWKVLRARPPHLHVLDVGLAMLPVAVAARLVGARLVLDTGDEHEALVVRTRGVGGSALAGALAGVVERLALGLASAVAARGRTHVAALRERGYNDVRWLPDGVDAARFESAKPDPWRLGTSWEGALVVASLGSLLVDERYRVTQGSDLVEALALVEGVKAVIVGEGPGLGLLVDRARALGVSERVRFVGWQEPHALPGLIKSFDVCLSTQTDDAVGHARTTGKLPLFMAAGRFVLATAVGEAARVLPPAMLLPYRGEHDPEHPGRLARRLFELQADRAELDGGKALPEVARRLFDYSRLEAKAAALAGEAV